MTIIKYLFLSLIGIIALAILLYLMFQIWFWILKRSEKNSYLNKIKELGLEDLKFEKADQFALLDGSVSSNEIFSKYKIMEHIPEFYFFDIGKEDYINHLIKNPPKNE